MRPQTFPSFLGAGSSLLAYACLALVSCDVDKKEDGALPKVKMEVEGEAKLPKYEVHGPEVTVGEKKVEMKVPTIDVDVPKEGDNEPAQKPESEQK